MPYVPAHTNLPGHHVQQTHVANYWTLDGYKGQPSMTFGMTNNPITAQSFKSPIVDGQWLNAMEFRKATSYTRMVHRIESLRSFDFVVGSYQYYGDDSREMSLGGFPGSGGFSPATGAVSVDFNMRNRAVTEAYQKLQGMKVNLGAALGEAKRTVNMIVTRLISLVKAILALSDGKFSYAYWHLFGSRPGVRSSQDAASLWLEWQYGWRPLIGDIWAGIEQVREGFRKGNLLFNVKRTLTLPLDPGRFYSPADVAGYTVTTGEASESTRVSFWGRVRNEQVQNLSALGLINPLQVAWELTRLSFVIDWLVPVGAWLESLGATSGIDFVDGSRTDTVTWDVQGEYFPYALKRGVTPKTRTRGYAMQRHVYSSWPWAFVYYKDPFTTTHMTSALALLRQARR